MRRQLNIKVLITLLTGSVFLGSGLYWLHHFQQSRHAAALLVKANQAEAQGDLPHLAHYLDRYLTLDPSNTDALARYGLALAQQANSPRSRSRAISVLDRVIRLAPSRADVCHRRVSLKIDLGDLAGAQQDLILLLKQSPHNGELEYLLGRCEQGRGNAPEAVSWYAKAMAHTPAQVDSYIRLARLLRDPLGKTDKADEIMEQLIAANRRAPAAYLARARYRQEFQSLEEADQDMAEARLLAPDHVEVLVESGKLAALRGVLDEARRYLRRAQELYPNHAPLYAPLAAVEQKSGRPAEAVTCLRQALQVVPETERTGLMLRLADVLIQEGDLPAADEVLALWGKDKPSPLRDLVEARFLIQKGQWRRAVSILLQLRRKLGINPDVDLSANLLLAESYGKLGDWDRELAAYQNAVTLGPKSSAARLGLGNALLTRGRAADSIQELRQLMTLSDPPAAGWALLAKALIVQNLTSPEGDRNWREVEQVLDQAAKVTPQAPEVPILRADAWAAQGQSERAQAVLEKARERHPEQVDLWVALADWADRQRKPDTAAGLLAEAGQRFGERVELVVARVRRLARLRGGPIEAELARAEQQIGNFGADEQDRLMSALAEAYLHTDQMAAVERLWKRLAARQLDSLGIRLLLFELAMQTNQDQLAQRQIVDLKRIEGDDGTWWRYCESMRLIARSAQGAKEDLLQAKTCLAEVAARRPGWSRVLIAEAAICELHGDKEQALDKYQRALDAGKCPLTMIQRLIRLLYEQQRYREADQLISNLQNQANLRDRLGAGTTPTTLDRPSIEQALALARTAATKERLDHHYHLWLGHSQWAAGKRTEAEMSLRRALQLNDRIPETWVALISFLAGTDQLGKAQAALQDAERQLTPDQAPLALAHACEVIGQAERAEAYYASALKSRPDDAICLRGGASFYLRARQFAKAEAHLRKLVTHNTASARDVAWARRSLAIGLAERGYERPFREALALLECNAQLSQGESVGDLRTRALVLATRPSHQLEAIAILEDLGRRQALTPDDQFLLVQLLEGQNNWQKADRWMGSLLVVHSGNRLYLSYDARSKMRRKDVNGAQIRLDRLEQLHPQAWETAEIKARILHAQDKGDEATAVLEKYIASRPRRPQEATVVSQAAAILEEFGQFPAAEKMFQEFAARSEKADSQLALIAFLGRRKQLAKALDLCERAWEACSPEAVAATCVTLVRTNAPTTEQVQRVDHWLEKALAKHSGMIVIQVFLADLRDLQGRYEEAEALYRQVIKQKPDNLRALNNLAMLIALRGGQPKEALNLINRAIDLYGPEAPLRDTRAVVFLAAGQSDAALMDLRRAIEQAPAAAYYFHLAQAHLQQQNQGAIVQALSNARKGGLTLENLHPLERPAFRRVTGVGLK